MCHQRQWRSAGILSADAGQDVAELVYLGLQTRFLHYGSYNRLNAAFPVSDRRLRRKAGQDVPPNACCLPWSTGAPYVECLRRLYQ